MMNIERNKIICITINKIYFKHEGYLCSGTKGRKEDIRTGTFVKHGLLEEEKQ